jgi:hypothetical protein
MNTHHVTQSAQPVQQGRIGAALVTIVVLHLAISFVHGAAHSGAGIGLGLAGSLFVYIVILAGPIVGLIIGLRRRRLGASFVAYAMTGSLVFGVVNHFIIQGSDHVTHVPEAWRTSFTVTAILLAVLEAAGALIGWNNAVRT